MRKKQRSSYEIGLKRFVEIRGKQESRELTQGLAKLCPDFGKYSLEFVWGEIWNRDVLDYKTKELITIAILVAMGGKENRVKEHVKDALTNGVRLEEILEVMIHLTAYAGFPTAANGLQVVRETLEEKAKAKPLSPGRDSRTMA